MMANICSFAITFILAIVFGVMYGYLAQYTYITLIIPSTTLPPLPAASCSSAALVQSSITWKAQTKKGG